jgi:hypothetical protein
MAQTRIKKEIIPKDIQDASKNLLNNSDANLKVNEVVSNTATRYLDRMKSGNSTEQIKNKSQMDYSPINSLLTNTHTDQFIKEAYAENPEYWGSNLFKLKKEAIERAQGDILRIKSGQPTKAQAQLQEEEQARSLEESQQMALQVGQTAPEMGMETLQPTGLDYGEAVTSGLVSGIPNMIRMAGQAAVGGAVVGAVGGLATGGIFSAPLAIIGAGATFIGSLAGSMISNMKQQRRDTTTAQKRVLDEGKQTLKDWVTLAEQDPANKQKYLSEFNKVSAQIDQAYRQMKLDTQRDVLKFETAIPDLAEFETYYASGGERDVLNIEMRQALLLPTAPDYKMLELINRRNNENAGK